MNNILRKLACATALGTTHLQRVEALKMLVGDEARAEAEWDKRWTEWDEEKFRHRAWAVAVRPPAVRPWVAGTWLCRRVDGQGLKFKGCLIFRTGRYTNVTPGALKSRY